jgi:hypothetical protein
MRTTELKTYESLSGTCPIDLDSYIANLKEIPSLKQQTIALENILRFGGIGKSEAEQMIIVEKIANLVYDELVNIYELSPQFACNFSPDTYKITLFDGLDVYGMLRMYKTAGKEFDWQKNKGLVTRNAIRSHLLKTSLNNKLEKLDWDFTQLKDLIRFTIEKKDFGSIENLAQDSLKVVKLMETKGYKILQREAKYDQGTKYSDITLQFINQNRATAFTPNGMIVEVKFQSQIGMEAKDKETPTYNLRRDLADEIRVRINATSKSSDFREDLNIFLGDQLDPNTSLSTQSIEEFLQKQNYFGDCQDLLHTFKKYKELLIISRKILEDVPRIINSKEDALSFEARFDELNSQKLRLDEFQKATIALRNKFNISI